MTEKVYGGEGGDKTHEFDKAFRKLTGFIESVIREIGTGGLSDEEKEVAEKDLGTAVSGFFEKHPELEAVRRVYAFISELSNILGNVSVPRLSHRALSWGPHRPLDKDLAVLCLQKLQSDILTRHPALEKRGIVDNALKSVEEGERDIDEDFLKDCEVVFKGCISRLCENAEYDFETAEEVLKEIKKQLETEELVSRFKEEMTKYIEDIVKANKWTLENGTRVDTSKINNEIRVYESVLKILGEVM